MIRNVLPPGIQLDRTLPIADANQAYSIAIGEGPDDEQ